MTLTFRIGRSRSFERFITNCPNVSYFDITRFGPSVHRITTKIMTLLSVLYVLKPRTLTFDIDLESQKKNWDEPFLKFTRET